VAVCVQSGRLGAGSLRALRAVVSRDDAAIGVLVTLDEPTEALVAEAARAGFHASAAGRHPRLQILRVGDVLRGRRVDVPRAAGPGIKGGKRGAVAPSPALLYRASE
jgi:hypothetical protein